MRNQIETSPESSPAGWRVSEWARGVGISRAGFYLLSAEYRPRAVKIGKRHIITEAPADWLNRMTRCGGVPISRRSAA